MSFESGDLPVEAVPTPEKRDQRILEVTGIRPDSRYFVPAEEKVELVRGVQAGDTTAAEALVATRLHWLYHTYTERGTTLHPGVADVGLQDFFHIGGLAVIQAAEHIGRTTGGPINTLHSRTPDLIRKAFDDSPTLLDPPAPLVALMNRGKLLPARAPDGSIPLYTAAQETEDARMPEQVELAGPDMPETSDFDSATDILFLEAARKVFERLDERRRFVAESWFGLGRSEQKLEQVGEQLGITKARAAQLKDEVVAKLRSDPLIRRIGLERGYEELEEQEEPAPPEAPKWEPENNSLQQAWLDEIREKQERGEIAFVRGNLLTRPLPPAVGVYLFWSQQYPDMYDSPAKKLRQAKRNPHREL